MANADGNAAAAAGAEEPPTCPICLNDMSPADALHPVPCPAACQFNFCMNCLSHLLASSKDDYEMASDGNRAVKVHLNCPNCRADISGTIEDTIRLRRQALADELQTVPDSELSAQDLQLKHWKENKDGLLFDEEGKKIVEQKGAKPLEIDPSLFRRQEQRYVTQLMTSGYPDQLCQAAQILSGVAELLRQGKTPAMLQTAASHESNGSHAPNSAAAATARTTAALQHGYANAGIRTNRSRDGERDTPVSNFQRQMEEKKREKLRRPLPARMPLCVTLSTGEFEKMALKAREPKPAETEQPKSWWRGLLGKGAGLRGGATMTFVDDEWDGSVADAFARARIGASPDKREQQVVQARVGPKSPVEQAGVRKILSMGDEHDAEERPTVRTQRVLVGSVRGQAGKSGIMRGDVVTYVNGEVFTGDAARLNALLVNSYEEQGKEGVVMIVVNAEACTAEALRLRARVR
ncbi:hypothetical protein ACHAXT_008795 [Thalassiosira profunda]